MINLLPNETKYDIRAARANVVLLRYNLLSLAIVALLAGVCAVFYIIMHNNQSHAVTTSSDNSAVAASYDDIRKQADEYRTNLAIASKILANGTNYTSVVFGITKLLPSGVLLDQLTLNASDFNKQTSFTAHAQSYDKAAELKQNFQNSPMFSNVFFQSLTDSSAGGAAGDYPITVTLSAKLNAEIK